MGSMYKEANNPKKFTCILLKSSFLCVEDGCGFPFSPLILTLPVTDWKRQTLLSSKLLNFTGSHDGFNIFTQLKHQ